FRILVGLCFTVAPGLAQNWLQWGQNSQHGNNVSVIGQSPARLLADIVYDPFVPLEMDDAGGALLVHYPAPIVDRDDVFMLFKAGTYVVCKGSQGNFPCGSAAWNQQVWQQKRLTWRDGQLTEAWTFSSDWTPPPDGGGLGSWEPVFHAALTGQGLWIPGFGGSVYLVSRDDRQVQ